MLDITQSIPLSSQKINFEQFSLRKKNNFYLIAPKDKERFVPQRKEFKRKEFTRRTMHILLVLKISI